MTEEINVFSVYERKIILKQKYKDKHSLYCENMDKFPSKISTKKETL